jgi:ABC-type multidrug transport system ATPase subunit
MDEAEELCDRVGIMLNGNIIALDQPEALKRRYQQNGHLPDLEEVFMAATGSSLEDADLAEQEKEEAHV